MPTLTQLSPADLRHLRCLKNKGCIDTTTPLDARRCFTLFRTLGLIKRNTGGGTRSFWDFTPAGEAQLEHHAH